VSGRNIVDRFIEAVDRALARLSGGTPQGASQPTASRSTDESTEENPPAAETDPPRPTSTDEAIPTSGKLLPQSPLERSIVENLSQTIDPGTAMDVVSMGLIRDLHADEDGRVDVTFAPSSPVCPLAFKLATDIRAAVEDVAGVSDVHVKVENYVHADQLMAALNG